MALTKYLSHYAEPHTQQLTDFPYNYDYACVIPCFNENEEFLQVNKAVFHAASSLIIVVINEAPSERSNANNVALQNTIEASFPILWRSKGRHLTLFKSGEASHLLCVDAYTAERELPTNQGVGLARKIGADIACQLFDSGNIAKPWIFTTDADVALPHNYFCSATKVSEAAAIIFPYWHTRPADPKQAFAIDLYEYSLHYYVEGLNWAGSPYAFQTVGSTLAIHAEHYARVRGFPKRSAGEDFYILNKLRKTGDIVTLSEPVITIAGRVSNRTPFGTGAALSQIMQLEDAERDYVFYHPKVFELLRQYLEALPSIWRQLHKTSKDERDICKAISGTIADENLLCVLKSLGLEAGIQHAMTHSKDLNGFLKHTHDWFDAFRTLKLIHSLRDKHYPSISITELQKIVPKILPGLPIRAESSIRF